MKATFRTSLLIAIALFVSTPLFAQKTPDQYIQDLNSDDPVVQMEACRALGIAEEKKAVGPLTQLMESAPDKHVAASAAAALGAIGDKSAAPAVVRTANQSDDDVVKYAALLAAAALKDDGNKADAVAAAEKMEGSNDELLSDLALKIKAVLQK